MRNAGRTVVGRIRRRAARARRMDPSVKVQPDATAALAALRRRACTAEALTRWHASGSAGTLPRPEATSQWGEDALLWDLFGAQETGFFIEAGAFDGYTFSATYLFECVGWSGLLVEPLPERAAQCRQRRPGSRVVEAALTRPGGTEPTTLTIVESAEMLSYVGGTPIHARRLADEGAALSTRQVPVEAVTLDQLLDGREGPIDFCVLDVEGDELAVLEGFDLRRWQPRALLIEDNSAGADGSVRRYMRDREYERAGVFFGNDLYLRQNDEALRQRLVDAHWSVSGALDA